MATERNSTSTINRLRRTHDDFLKQTVHYTLAKTVVECRSRKLLVSLISCFPASSRNSFTHLLPKTTDTCKQNTIQIGHNKHLDIQNVWWIGVSEIVLTGEDSIHSLPVSRDFLLTSARRHVDSPAAACLSARFPALARSRTYSTASACQSVCHSVSRPIQTRAVIFRYDAVDHRFRSIGCRQICTALIVEPL